MDFELNEDQRMLQQEIRNFATKEVAKGAADRDETAEMPGELISQLAELGLFGISIPEQYGGAGLGTIESSLVVEEISRVTDSVHASSEQISRSSKLLQQLADRLEDMSSWFQV